MDIRQQFELMIKDHFPDANLRRDELAPAFYEDQAVQTAWVGFDTLHTASQSDTTKGVTDNYAKEHFEDS